MNRDPKRGTILASGALRDTDAKPVSFAGSKPGAILFVEDCLQCSSGEEIERWEELQKKHPERQFYVVPTANADAAQVRRFQRENKLSLRFVVAGAAELERQCNSFFLPRVYGFDAQGRLSYVQPPLTNSEDAMKKIAEELR